MEISQSVQKLFVSIRKQNKDIRWFEQSKFERKLVKNTFL